MEIRAHRVAVVGAGMAGLAAAYELDKKGFPVTVFERNPYVGGRIRTDVHQRQVIEGGAQSYFHFYRLTRKLIRELDLAQHEAYVSRSPGILRNEEISGVSSGLTSLFGRHLSARSKLLLGKILRPLLARWSQLDSENLHRAHRLDTKSVAEYARQELNQEILEYVFEPLLSGIFYWPAQEVSQAALFVLLRQAILGLRPMTLKGGLGSLPRAIAQKVDVRARHTVTQITMTESGTYNVAVDDGSQRSRDEFDAVICATTATAIPRLIPFLNPTQKAFFQSIRYTQNVNIAVEVEDDPVPERCSFFVPLVDGRTQALGAVTRRSGRVISLFSSAEAGPDLVGETDGVVSTRLIQDLQNVLPGENQRDFRPISRLTYRWREALPILDVGYFKRLRAFRTGGIESGKLVFCGDYLGGAFLEGAVSSGTKAANRLTARL